MATCSYFLSKCSDVLWLSFKQFLLHAPQFKIFIFFSKQSKNIYTYFFSIIWCMKKNTKLGKIIIFSLVVFDNSVNKLFIHSEYLQSLNSHEQREITLNWLTNSYGTTFKESFLVSTFSELPWKNNIDINVKLWTIDLIVLQTFTSLNTVLMTYSHFCLELSQHEQ